MLSKSQERIFFRGGTCVRWYATPTLSALRDAGGEIAFQHTGLNRDPAPLIAAIEKVARSAQR